MASKTFGMKFFSLLISSFAFIRMTAAGDPDILSDFVAPPGLTPDGNYFTFTGLRFLVDSDPPKTFNVSKASLGEFPALNGQSVSLAVLEFPSNSTNPPHTHPRSAELLFLAAGTLDVGFVDTTNKLFTQKLQIGDIFVFPKGMVHFQFNANPQEQAIAVSGFGSANAGTVSLPKTLFSTDIDDNVLALSFNTDVATIRRLKAGLGA